ncbi:hypothetical protein P3T76_007994 [Phytophthora citrophthora]|uniref:RxLR effector protein n=1 Tax=Phytophthora citrophthora TaxID=4793 RepID=A0AAD9GLQ1_9STRA|nr:hypothetical protein P3T76_007994 [Phytophthora citrophthora]
MRVSYFLLVATATLLTSCNAVATTSNNRNKLSMTTSIGAAIAARNLKSSNDKRFLRSYREENEDDNDNEKEEKEGEEEERAVMTPAQVAKWTARAEYWVKAGHSPDYIRDKLTGLNGQMNAKNAEKYRLFGAAWGKAYSGDLGRRVRRIEILFPFQFHISTTTFYAGDNSFLR